MKIIGAWMCVAGLFIIGASDSLAASSVAQWHVIDAVENEDSVFDGACNLHSWSNMQPELWSAVCYTPDHAQASKMWVKPKEITGRLFRSNGYEIADWGYTSVAAMMLGWQTSPGHNDVILNQGIWSGFPWKAMGVGVDLQSRYYFVWFSDVTDSQGEVQACSESTSFGNSFE